MKHMICKTHEAKIYFYIFHTPRKITKVHEQKVFFSFCFFNLAVSEIDDCLIKRKLEKRHRKRFKVSPKPDQIVTSQKKNRTHFSFVFK